LDAQRRHNHPTDYWAEEFVVPHRTFRRQGVEVHVTKPDRVRPTLDQVGLNPQKPGGEGMAPTFA
jgi:putative intracellular protease/amidase